MSQETNYYQKYQTKGRYSRKKNENRKDTQAKHPHGWCKVNHYGMCGQSCPCCRAQVGDTFGACPICK